MRRPSPALVVAVIALIVAMGGTSWAVTQLPRNSVGAPQLKKNAVTSLKIMDGTIATADLSTAARSALKGETGATGPSGAAGPPGATGATGPSTSAGAWHIPTPFAMTGTFQEVIALSISETTESASTGTISVPTSSHLVVAADVTFEETAGNPVKVGCTVEYRTGTTGTWGSLAYSYVTLVTLASSTQSSLTASGLQPVDAGTYDVRVRCREYGGTGNANFSFATMTVVATGR